MRESGTKSRLRPRRIIERPRLTRLLDNSTARVRMLIAPAGYGKTTLAEQWTSAPGRTAAWYQCRRASADVAHLAIGLAEAASAILPGCDTRLRERLLATKDPSVEVAVLAEILAEDMAGWPADSWLVIDDYHLLRSACDAELFIEHLAEQSPVSFLITSRNRPVWSTGRSVLHGEVLTIGQDVLAMSESEATDALEGHPEPLADSLRRLASGWPAVIGLAHITQTAIWPDGSAAEELYQYVAEEVYRNLGSEVERDLGKLVLAPRLDRDLAQRLVGDVAFEVAVAAGVEAGILNVRGNEYAFHPLARAFIESRRSRQTRASERRIVGICLDAYRDRHDWDSAFELIERHGMADDFDAIIAEALDELLETGRLATIETWVRTASEKGEPSARVRLAATELAVRRGELSIAETFIQGVLGTLAPGSPIEFRAFMLAGQIAHLDGREQEAVDRYSRAEATATSPVMARDARWGRCMTLAALEDKQALPLLDELVADVAGDDPREQIRAADKQISIAVRFGALPSLARARSVQPLLDIVADPNVRCSFLSVFSGALVLAAHYDDALNVASDLIRDAAESHSFGLTYGHANSALALAGKKRYVKAHAALDKAHEAARLGGDTYGLQNVYATRVRLMLQQGRIPEACLLEPPDVSTALPGMRGEVLGCRALALAAVGRAADALKLAKEASESSRALETAVLVVAVRAVIDVRAGDDAALGSAATLLEEASTRGAVDLFVTSYRAVPDILALLLANPQTRDRALFAVGRADDREMAAAGGVPVEAVFDPVAALSPRERDVYALLCEGLSDREIAKLLFIAPGTTKTHTHSILEKTGFKTRRALMLEAARRRLTQAAPTATEEIEGSGDS